MARGRTLSKEAFGPALARLMAERGATYRSLAAATGLSAGYLNHLAVQAERVARNNAIFTAANESSPATWCNSSTCSAAQPAVSSSTSSSTVSFSPRCSRSGASESSDR